MSEPSHRVAFASMCVSAAGYAVPGAAPSRLRRGPSLYGRCAASVCSLLRWPSLADHPVLYLVDAAFRASLREPLLRAHRVSLLNSTLRRWPPTRRFPRAPLRLFNFHQFAAWRLGTWFDRIVWFDSDALWANDPARLSATRAPNTRGRPSARWR